jgi:hypothetical protein
MLRIEREDAVIAISIDFEVERKPARRHELCVSRRNLKFASKWESDRLTSSSATTYY